MKIDPLMVKLVEAMNRVPGLHTSLSWCEGHKPEQAPFGTWTVNFEVEESAGGMRALSDVVHAAAATSFFCIVSPWWNGMPGKHNGELCFVLEGKHGQCTPDDFATCLDTTRRLVRSRGPRPRLVRGRKPRSKKR